MKKTLLEALAINAEKISTIAVVGGGGKTSLIFRLMESFVSIGKKVIVTTTTHMAYEPERPFVEDGDIDGVWKDLQRYHYTVAASLDRATEKIGCLSEEKLEELRGLADVLLIEADGAKRLPLKVPGEREPVIPEFAEMVIGVVGVDALGEPIQKTCHRPEKVADFLGKGMEEVVTEDDIVKIAVSAEALRKCVDGREYCVLLNKADIRGKAEAAERIAGKLEEQGVHAVWGSLQKQNYNSICNCIDRTEEKAEVWMNKLQEPQNKGSQAQEKPTFIMLAAGKQPPFRLQQAAVRNRRSADVSAYIAQASKGSVRTRKLRDHSRHPVRRNSFQSTRIRSPGPDQFTPGTWHFLIHADRPSRCKRIGRLPFYRIRPALAHHRDHRQSGAQISIRTQRHGMHPP